jgi:hypothetical protein
MTASTVDIHPWETREYGRIVSVRFRSPSLFVTFADGAEVGVEVDRFDNPFIRSRKPDWARARAGGHEVIVPTASGDLGIPWDSIRALTDAGFAAHWAKMTANTALDVGARLRGFREARRLSTAELAHLVGVPAAKVDDVETGSSPIDLDLLDRLLAALGRTADDLIDESDADTA